MIAEVYSSSQAISSEVWGLFRRYLFSITTGPWSHQHLYAHRQQLTFSEVTNGHWSLMWRNCSLPAHTYYGTWNQTSKMQTCEATGCLVNTGQSVSVIFRSLAYTFSSLYFMDYLRSRVIEPWVNLRRRSTYLGVQPWVKEVFSKKSI